MARKSIDIGNFENNNSEELSGILNQIYMEVKSIHTDMSNSSAPQEQENSIDELVKKLDALFGNKDKEGQDTNIFKTLDNSVSNLAKEFDKIIEQLKSIKTPPPTETVETGRDLDDEKNVGFDIKPEITKVDTNKEISQVAQNLNLPQQQQAYNFTDTSNIDKLSPPTEKSNLENIPKIESPTTITNGSEAAVGMSNIVETVAPVVEAAETVAPVALAALAEGGSTKSTAFTVGEGDATHPNPATTEMVLNPTGAPIQVISAPQLQSMDHMSKTYGDVEHYASGTTAGYVGSSLSSGGEFNNPNQVISGVSQGVQSLIGMLPEVGPVINSFIQGLEYAVQALTDIVEGFNKLAEKISPYSGEIMGARAEVQVMNIEKDIETAQDIGPQLAQLYKESNSIWIDIQKIMRSISEPFLDFIVPLVHSIHEIFETITPYIRVFFDAIGMLVNILFNPTLWFSGHFDDYIIQKSEEIKRHLNPSDKEPPFASALFDAALEASRLSRERSPVATIPGVLP